MARCAYTNVDFARIFILTTDGAIFSSPKLQDYELDNEQVQCWDLVVVLEVRNRHLYRTKVQMKVAMIVPEVDNSRLRDLSSEGTIMGLAKNLMNLM